MPNENPIDSAIKTLENKIGFPSGRGMEETIILPSTREAVIQWCVLKGLARKSASLSSNQTLGKLYGIPNYLHAAIRNDKFKPKTPSKISSDLDLDMDEEEVKIN